FVALYLFARAAPEQWQLAVAPFSKLNSKFESIVALLIAAYVLGHVVSPAARIVEKLSLRIPKEVKRPDESKLAWLRIHRPDAGSNCNKLRAESTLYNSLSAVFFVFAIWQVFFPKNVFLAAFFLVLGVL